MAAAKIFGESLYALAESEGLDEEILSDLKSVVLIFEKYPDYVKILDSPHIERGDLMMILNEDFTGRINRYTLNFIKLLCERRMVRNIGECLSEYEKLYNEKHNVKIVTVTTAKPLSESLADKLVKKLEAKYGGKIALKRKVDESCIGGIIIEADGSRVDMSVKTKLSELKKAIS